MPPLVLAEDAVNVQGLPLGPPCRAVFAGRTGLGLTAGALGLPVPGGERQVLGFPVCWVLLPHRW